jgi:hypothetical protein
MFMSMARTFPRREHLSGALGLLANIPLGWKKLPRNKQWIIWASVIFAGKARTFS